MFAYVPARGGSKRIPRKNLRVLGGKPLLAHVLDALSNITGLSGISVSSEDSQILELANSYSNVTTLAPRAEELANDMSNFSDLVNRDVPRYAEHFDDRDIIFITATAALVDKKIYQDVVTMFDPGQKGLVMAVTAYQPSALLALSGDPDSAISPIFPDMYTRPTKDLPQTFADSGCFYAMNIDRAMLVQRFIDMAPIRGVVLPSDVGIDLDTEEDWCRLENAYENRTR